MDLLNLLINPNKLKSYCFLCLKPSVKTLCVFEDIEIHDEYIISLNINLSCMMKSLFPTYDMVLTRACEDCAHVIIKIFSLIQRNYFRQEMLNGLIDNINEEVNNHTGRHNSIKCKLKVNLPNCDNLVPKFKKPSIIIQCKKCDMKFKSKSSLKKHIQISHKNIYEAIICDICGKMFNKSSSLKVHFSSHKEKQCPYCLKVLKSHSHFNFHIKNHKQQLTRKRIHKYYHCVTCDYRSLNKNTLEAHINKIHLNIRPFVCEICQKGFYKKSNLTQHCVTHTKVKDKTCEICGDTFLNEKTLVEHLMLHSGRKPFKCKICNTDFITSGRRLEHMKRKHMEKTECCVICGKKFSLRKGLNSHLKNVHGAENYILKLDNVQTDSQVFMVINYTK